MTLTRCLLKLLAAACGMALLAGCAGFDGYPRRSTDPDADLAQLAPHIDGKAIHACLSEPTLACRNKIIAARTHAIDVRFSEFEEDLFRQTRKAGFASTLASLGLTSAAAVSSGGTARSLSGLAAFVLGGRETFQKEVLAERTVVAIHTAMRARRAQVALRLRSGLAQPIERYPLALGLADLNEYYSAGTILGALVGIADSVSASAQKAESELQTTLSFRSLDASGKKFEQAICGGVPNCPNPDEARYPAIRACWPAAGVPADTLMVDFILQERFANARERVAACMKF